MPHFTIEDSVLFNYNGDFDEHIVVPYGVTRIGREAFSFSFAKSIELPDARVLKA